MNTNYGLFDYSVIQIDSNGNQLNTYNYGGTNKDQITCMAMCPDSNLLLFGQSLSSDVDIIDHINNWDSWLVKIDQNGTILNTKSFGTTNSDHGRSIINTFDYGYILGGFSYGNPCTNSPNSYGGKDWFIIKLNASFDPYNDSIALSDFTYNLCQGDSLLFGNEYILTSGMHYSVIENSKCDSAIFTNIILNTSFIFIENDTILCQGDSLQINGVFQSFPGTYDDTLVSFLGCDSILRTQLAYIELDTSVSLTNNILSSNDSTTSYQWFDCTGGFIELNGQVNQDFMPTNNGEYAVVISFGNCVDTSACHSVKDIGILESNFSDGLLLYPNPSDGKFSIDLGENYPAVKATITDLNRRLIESVIYNKSQILNFNLDNPAGVYFLIIESEENKAIIRLIKE